MKVLVGILIALGILSAGLTYQEFVQSRELAKRPKPNRWELTRPDWKMTEAEVRQRHESVLMRPIPSYATTLRGKPGTRVAEWMFAFPEDKRSDLERYLLDLGVPEYALLDEPALSTRGFDIHLENYDEVTKDAAGLVFFFTVAMPADGRLESFGIEEDGSGYFQYYFVNPKIRDRYSVVQYYPNLRIVLAIDLPKVDD